MRRGRQAGIGFVASAFALAPTPALAHAFGARYDLPLPLWLYLTGAGTTVALTFVLLVLFMGPNKDPPSLPAVGLERISRMLFNPGLRVFVSGMAVSLFALVLASGFLGDQNPIRNFAPTMVWVVWWVGLALLTALVGNIWPALNPWTALYDAVASAASGAGAARTGRGYWRYPPALGLWPSVGLFAAFAWIELVSEVGERPRTLACLILGYSLITWTGMAAFGRDRWLMTGEAFHQAFGLLGRFAPIAAADGRLVLRPYGAGLVASEPVRLSMTAFVMLMLSTVSFDGFVETPAWSAMLDWLAEDQSARPLLIWLQGAGVDLLTLVKTIALVVFPLAFMGVYLIFCAASAAMAGSRAPVRLIANTQCLSLVPIAIAYHVAHYLSFLLLAGQLIVPLVSDPFGWGWDLFGTAGYKIDITVIDAATVWYVAVIAIVLGHAIAVWLAHVMALALYRQASAALRSQIPMLVLMVLYTMLSLWILSQPIIAG